MKAGPEDFLGRFREVIADPLNLLIERVPLAGTIQGSETYLHNGNIVPIVGNDAYYGPFSQLLVINRGVHEPLEEYVFQELMRKIPEAPAMIELGAYWAHYSMWLKKVRPKSTVILVEPEQANLAVGMRNFQRNGFAGEFIGAYVGRGQFEVDAFLRSRSLAHLDILHVDIQGNEGQMLEGAQASLAEKRIDYLFVSTHSQELHAHVAGELRRFGYRVEVSSDFDHETTSYDGFVFASSPEAPCVFDRLMPLGRAQIEQAQPDQLLQALNTIKRSTI